MWPIAARLCQHSFTEVNTGVWAKKAIKEAKLFGEINVAYSSEEQKYNRVPTEGEYTVPADSEYLYLVSNNTIYGIQFPTFPGAGVHGIHANMIH